MRGTLVAKLDEFKPLGIIPAHAGNTNHLSRHVPPQRDHPRACGEHPCSRVVLSSPRGSSPRMRGTHEVGALPTSYAGIIPAHAGNTSTKSSSRSDSRDHPRACGEHKINFHGRNPQGGSSPRMRGTRMRTRTGAYYPGIIPAHAGNTSWWGVVHLRARDHPRACGEHTSLPTVSFIAMGSSPRMRGTHGTPGPWFTQAGIIPAHAGNTVLALILSIPFGDHPRACGEHRGYFAQA